MVEALSFHGSPSLPVSLTPHQPVRQTKIPASLSSSLILSQATNPPARHQASQTTGEPTGHQLNDQPGSSTGFIQGPDEPYRQTARYELFTQRVTPV